LVLSSTIVTSLPVVERPAWRLGVLRGAAGFPLAVVLGAVVLAVAAFVVGSLDVVDLVAVDVVLVDFAIGSAGGMYSSSPPPTAWLACACHSASNSRAFPLGYVTFHFPAAPAGVADASSDGEAMADEPPHDEQPMSWFPLPTGSVAR
jgi:hypothetical protein